MHYTDFDPCVIRQRNEELLREVSTLRLEKRPRNDRSPIARRLVSFVSKHTSPVLRRVRLTGRSNQARDQQPRVQQR